MSPVAFLKKKEAIDAADLLSTIDLEQIYEKEKYIPPNLKKRNAKIEKTKNDAMEAVEALCGLNISDLETEEEPLPKTICGKPLTPINNLVASSEMKKEAKKAADSLSCLSARDIIFAEETECPKKPIPKRAHPAIGNIKLLVAQGYKEEDARNALIQANNDIMDAKDILV